MNVSLRFKLLISHAHVLSIVDADQVIRGDLKELRDMDLQGAPYGYSKYCALYINLRLHCKCLILYHLLSFTAPFCTSRESTLGYQFWRDGFWKSHLRGKPYHISALYVVDLETFRRTLVGDQLRSTYQQLSGAFQLSSETANSPYLYSHACAPHHS